VKERKLDPAMPGVTGSPTCPASGNPSTTAGKPRYRRRRPVPACAAVGGGICGRDRLESRGKSSPFALISKALAAIMILARGEHLIEDIHSF
jgi:hypothetical protein